MTNPVAPVEGPLYLLFTEYENTTNIRKWSKEPFYGAQEYVPVSELERLRTANEKMKATMQEVRLIAVDALFQPTYQRTALERISAELRAALEGPTHE